MLYKEAESFVESLVFARRAISAAVQSARLQQQADRLEFTFRTGGDITARRAIQNLTPIAVVRCIFLGQTFLVYQPEGWLNAIQKAFELFRQRFGDESYTIIKHRYTHDWSVKHACAVDGVSRQIFALRRKDFLSGLLLLAAQEGLIRVDADLPKEKKD